MEELDRQGYTGPLEPRSYNPDRKMMRKSQRSNNLRLRFGKRSISPLELESMRNANWKVKLKPPKIVNAVKVSSAIILFYFDLIGWRRRSERRLKW